MRVHVVFADDLHRSALSTGEDFNLLDGTSIRPSLLGDNKRGCARRRVSLTVIGHQHIDPTGRINSGFLAVEEPSNHPLDLRAHPNLDDRLEIAVTQPQHFGRAPTTADSLRTSGSMKAGDAATGTEPSSVYRILPVSIVEITIRLIESSNHWLSGSSPPGCKVSGENVYACNHGGARA